MIQPEALAKLRSSRLFLLVLVVIAALGPGSMSMFIPALPAIQESYQVSTALVQLSMTISMAAMAIVTLFYGQLSDRYGRKPVLVTALAVCCAGSLLCAMAPTIWLFILGRVIQACGATAGIVLARAIVVDVFEEDKAARTLAFVTGAMMISPLIGPPLGGLLTDAISWRANFIVVFVIAGVICVIAWTFLTETVPRRVKLHGVSDLIGNWGAVITIRAFWAYVLFMSFLYAAFFSFFGGGPYVFVDVFGMTAAEYGLYSMLIALGMMGGNFWFGYFGGRFSDRGLILGGGFIATCAIGFIFVLLTMGIWEPMAIFLPATIMSFVAGASTPTAQVGATASCKELAGTASGLIGFIQTIISSIAAQTVAMVYNGTPYPMITLMAVCCLLALLSFAALWPGRAGQVARETVD